MQKHVLVLGLGNILMQDDGLGVHAIGALDAENYDPCVAIMDGGTLGIALLPHLRGITHLLIVDAISSGQEPGSLAIMHGAEVAPALGAQTSIHQAGVSDLIALAKLQDVLPDTVRLVGLEPASIALGTALSAPVASAMHKLIGAISRQLTAWGCVRDVSSESIRIAE